MKPGNSNIFARWVLKMFCIFYWKWYRFFLMLPSGKRVFPWQDCDGRYQWMQCQNVEKEQSKHCVHSESLDSPVKFKYMLSNKVLWPLCFGYAVYANKHINLLKLQHHPAMVFDNYDKKYITREDEYYHEVPSFTTPALTLQQGHWILCRNSRSYLNRHQTAPIYHQTNYIFSTKLVVRQAEINSDKARRPMWTSGECPDSSVVL